MKKLIRFIKGNLLVKGKIYFYIFNFFFIMNLGILHCYQNMFQTPIDSGLSILNFPVVSKK